MNKEQDGSTGVWYLDRLEKADAEILKLRKENEKLREEVKFLKAYIKEGLK